MEDLEAAAARDAGLRLVAERRAAALTEELAAARAALPAALPAGDPAGFFSPVAPAPGRPAKPAPAAPAHVQWRRGENGGGGGSSVLKTGAQMQMRP